MPAVPRATFVAVWAYGSGGVPRAVLTVANELAARGREIEVVSVYRTSAEPYVEVHPGVRLRWLEDLVDPAGGPQLPRARRNPARDRSDARLDRQPSALAVDAYPSLSSLTDRRLQTLFEAITGVVVTTRPELAVAAARWAPPAAVLVEAEHLTMSVRPAGVRDALVGVQDRLDALVLLTEADREAWRGVLHETTTTDVIPNASTFTPEAAPLEAEVVIAAGRLSEQKAFDRLVDAFTPVARDHPTWQLHIYGRGRKESELRAQIAAAGLADRVRLMGFTEQLEERLAEASVYAMSSRYEGFPMVLLEAMTKGVPPVSMDCPEGPRQLIDDGHNGLLVPRADVEALSAGIRRLVEDPELRRRLGRGALRTAEGYTVTRVVDRWEDLFDRLLRSRHGGCY